MTQANDNPSNGNGQKDYSPEVEFEYLDLMSGSRRTQKGIKTLPILRIF
ncbi:MAG: hypothetical protein KME17_00550 [Cyanosarcina radialis HA8281-LM2]|jgi:hypothetical protein|nr:hypothetical protein [Cyanosarcina radialis HA8281-LM2]